MLTAPEIYARVLSALENQELPALSWGLVDTAITPDKVLATIADSLDAVGDLTTDPGTVLDALILRALVVPVGENRFRTRFAESVRLFSRLRQLFPSHLRSGSWQGAPELVSDFRVLARPRSFPRRDIQAAQALADAAGDLRLNPLQRDALAGLLGSTVDDASISRFQADSLSTILKAVGQPRTSATIITAGTGSGKTRAFYTPALTYVCNHVDGPPWTKVLAIYPRVELLKDQFSELVRQVRLLQPVLRSHGKRPIAIGAFFGSTPYTARSAETMGWRRRKDDSLECPFLPCWECSAPMLWHEADREAGRERLVCRDCNTTSEPDEVVLTRQSLANRPPDVLFATTEMVNRHLSSTEYLHVFGAGERAIRRPALALIDEVHTYGGATGAQTAFVLRRWRHAITGPTHIVGLSATLEDPIGFMSRMTGVRENRVTRIAPREDDLETRGAEYLLALRGNPMSGTALLSTTIQSLMLLRRILNTDARGDSGYYGSRVFAFTDDLDVTNRLFFNLLDAEGRTYKNTPRHGGASLAALRSPDLPDAPARRLDGQVWDLPREIGHSLAPSGLSISRTSSQDAGVDTSSDVIVATASLEVGFDDARVGAVLQHKSPRDAATFLQRKGRAGRPQDMRPWTVVVLSDYGRDRISYQGYELLFDPTLRPLPIPIDNQHIQRMQAALAMVDWLSTRLGKEEPGSIWRDLAGPVAYIYERARPAIRDAAYRRQAKIAALLRATLEDPAQEEALRLHLRAGLSLSDDEVDAALWQPPRALMTSAIPTLLRRLESDWRDHLAGPAGEWHGEQTPLPEHVPPNLFSELNLPEVRVEAPSQFGEGVAKEESMGIAQALRELTPGRMTRRFAVTEGSTRHWIDLPEDGDIDVSSFIQTWEDLGQVTFEDNGSEAQLRVLRPWRARLSVAPKSVRDSQSAQPRWHTQIRCSEPGVPLPLPSADAWKGLLRDVEFYVHGGGCPVDVYRATDGSVARDPANLERTIETRFILHERGDKVPAALGFRSTVDAIKIGLNLPSTWPVDQLAIAVRRTWFSHLVETSPILQQRTSTFTRGWLSTLYAASLSAAAAAQSVGATHARDLLREAGVGRSLERAMDVIFEIGVDDAEPRDDASEKTDGAAQRLRRLLGDQEITDHLHELGAALTEPLPHSCGPWLTSTLASTVGAVFREAFQRLCPRLDVDRLIVDIESPDESARANERVNIWLSEEAPGGAGVVATIARDSLADPRRLLHLASAATAETEHEQIDHALRTIVRRLSNDDELVSAVRDTRATSDPITKASAFANLLKVVARRGIVPTHGVATAVAARILRPGSSEGTDQLLLRLLDAADELEERIGFEPDPRAAAFALSRHLDVGAALQGLPAKQDQSWRFAQIYSLMWPAGWEARSPALSTYNRFTQLPPAERLLAAVLLKDPTTTVSVDEGGWRERADSALAGDGSVHLTASRDRRDMRAALLNLCVEPVDLGFIHAYPRISRIQLSEHGVTVGIEIAELT